MQVPELLCHYRDGFYYFQYGCAHGLKSGDVIALLLGQIM